MRPWTFSSDQITLRKHGMEASIWSPARGRRRKEALVVWGRRDRDRRKKVVAWGEEDSGGGGGEITGKEREQRNGWQGR